MKRTYGSVEVSHQSTDRTSRVRIQELFSRRSSFSPFGNSSSSSNENEGTEARVSRTRKEYILYCEILHDLEANIFEDDLTLGNISSESTKDTSRNLKPYKHST